jgi:hypothetical protein
MAICKWGYLQDTSWWGLRRPVWGLSIGNCGTLTFNYEENKCFLAVVPFVSCPVKLTRRCVICNRSPRQTVVLSHLRMTNATLLSHCPCSRFQALAVRRLPPLSYHPVDTVADTVVATIPTTIVTFLTMVLRRAYGSL